MLYNERLESAVQEYKKKITIRNIKKKISAEKYRYICVMTFTKKKYKKRLQVNYNKKYIV